MEDFPLTVDTSPSSWAAKAESELSSLKDVADASIEIEDGEVRAVHVITHSHKSPKLIVRDVISLIRVKFKRDVDHRVVSVVYLTEQESASSRRTSVPSPGAEPDPISRPTPIDRTEQPAAAPEPEPEVEDRIRFGSVNLFVSGLRTQAQVELKWKGIPRMGSAAGWSTRAGAQRLIATATLAAIQEFLLDDVALGVHEVESVRLGRRRAIVVSLSLLAHRSEKILVGTCTVEQDPQQAVVLATLSALNRIFGGLRTKEPTVYVLRPTST